MPWAMEDAPLRGVVVVVSIARPGKGRASFLTPTHQRNNSVVFFSVYLSAATRARTRSLSYVPVSLAVVGAILTAAGSPTVTGLSLT